MADTTSRDAPLIQLLESMFLEQLPDTYETIKGVARQSPMWFPWRETKRRLDAAKTTSGDAFATSVQLLGCSVQSGFLPRHHCAVGGCALATLRPTRPAVKCVE